MMDVVKDMKDVVKGIGREPVAHVARINVSCGGLPVGTLAMAGKGKIVFEYARTWLEQGFDLAPRYLSFTQAGLDMPPTALQEVVVVDGKQESFFSVDIAGHLSKVGQRFK